MFTRLQALTFVFLATLFLRFERASGECCRCPTFEHCDDGKLCTPYCGHGWCNIFGCNCDGGCRTAQKSKRQNLLERSSSPLLSKADDESHVLFAAADTNGDGKMTFAEWRDSPVRSTFNNENDSMLAEHWAKYDTENVGYLTEDEAVNCIPR